MARKPVFMRKTREILRLKHEVGLGVRQIARSLHITHGTVLNYLARAEEAGIGWPLPAEADDKELGDLLFCSRASAPEARRPLPPMEYIHKELKTARRAKGVTLKLLWEEYRAEHPDGYGRESHRLQENGKAGLLGTAPK